MLGSTLRAHHETWERALPAALMQGIKVNVSVSDAIIRRTMTPWCMTTYASAPDPMPVPSKVVKYLLLCSSIGLISHF